MASKFTSDASKSRLESIRLARILMESEIYQAVNLAVISANAVMTDA
jgi:hypothetical protein